MVIGPHGQAPLCVSVGFSVIEPPGAGDGQPSKLGAAYFHSVAGALVSRALAALEDAQRSGGNAIRGSTPVFWPVEGRA
jgi:hypothetical protein